MSKSLMKLTAAALALCLALPAQAQDEMNADSVVATVNGKDITLAHVLLVRANLPEQYQQLPPEALWDGILNQIVQQEVLAQDDDAEETLRVRVALENERRSLLAAEVITKVAAAAASDEAVQEAYEANYVNGDMGMEYNAAHILVESEDEARAIIAEVEGGADFAETAKAKSTGPSGANGGALGWFSAGMMVQPFQDAVEVLEPGHVSGPVKTQFGWHVIMLNETRSKEAPELETVQAEIVQKLQEDAVSAYIESLVENADVTRTGVEDVDVSVINNLELLER